jgi:hypothetical protein
MPQSRRKKQVYNQSNLRLFIGREGIVVRLDDDDVPRHRVVGQTAGSIPEGDRLRVEGLAEAIDGGDAESITGDGNLAGWEMGRVEETMGRNEGRRGGGGW